jgi:sigma-E factor negative regulatory protein RseC
VIEERAVVTRSAQGWAWLQVQRQTACGVCHASAECGTGLLAKVWKNKTLEVRALSALPLQTGDQVIVGIAEGALLRGAMLIYLLPLVFLLLGAVLGQAVFATTGDELVALMGALGLSLGFLAAWVLSRRFSEDPRYQPVVLRRTI